jgi:inositol-hexakisphosphate kinase
MSESPTQPDNATPTVPVRPEQLGNHLTQDGGGDQNNLLQRILPPARRNNSASLLTRLLSTTHEEDEENIAGPSLDKSVAQSEDPFTTSPQGYGDSKFDGDVTSTHIMATTMGLPAALGHGLGRNPAYRSTPFDTPDMAQVDTLLMNHRAYLNTDRGRGTSLERTPKEKRVTDMAAESPSINPGDTGITHASTPISAASLNNMSDNPPTDGVRARYREWREPRPGITSEKTWSIGEERTGDSSEGQVEKSIAEALAGVEHNNRSRKASHTLRFFKEGLPEEKIKKRDLKDRGRSKDKSPLVLDFASSGTGYFDDVANHRPSTSRTNSAEQVNAVARPPSMHGEGPLSRVLSSRSSMTRLTTNTFADTQVVKEDVQQVKDVPQRRLPKQLLDDLRKNHNLTPAAIKGSSFSKSLPAIESEKPKQAKDLDANLAPAAIREEEEKGVGEPENEESPAAKTSDEDEDSGEEQISSALFVPHKSSRDKTFVDNGRLSEDVCESPPTHHRGSSMEPEQWLVEHEVEVKDKDGDKRKPGDKGFELKQVPSGHTSSDKAEAQQIPEPATHSESGYDSFSDAGYSTRGEDDMVEDGEVTPTGTLKAHNYMTQLEKGRLHDHQQTTKPPLEAIELIPYRHQVGGHTTMWRFSKRAVCKQLNNRENEFYEKVERYHPKLLKFMPRYVYLTYPPPCTRSSKLSPSKACSANHGSARQSRRIIC